MKDQDKTKKQLIPELVSSKKRQGKKLIRIWSAGCASGGEPYSRAILLKSMKAKLMMELATPVMLL